MLVSGFSAPSAFVRAEQSLLTAKRGLDGDRIGCRKSGLRLAIAASAAKLKRRRICGAEA
jgi:hypothetical protein